MFFDVSAKNIFFDILFADNSSNFKSIALLVKLYSFGYKSELPIANINYYY